MQKKGLLSNQNEVISDKKYYHIYFSEDKIMGRYPIIGMSHKKLDLIYDYYADSVKSFVFIDFDNVEKNYLLVKTRRKIWQVLDSNLNVLSQSKQFGINRINYPFDYSKIDNYLDHYFVSNQIHYDFLINTLHPANHVLYKIDFGKIDEKSLNYEDGYILEEPPKYGLVNYNSGKEIPVEYNFVVPRHHFREYPKAPLISSYWMIKEIENSNFISLEVYDTLFSLNNKLLLDDSSLYFLRQTRHRLDTFCTVMMNDKGLYELVKVDGSIIKEYSFTDYVFNPFDDFFSNFNVFILGLNGKLGLYSKSGIQITPLQYDSFIPASGSNSHEFFGKRGEIYDLFDQNGQIILDSISEIWISYYVKSIKVNSPFFIIRNGYIYSFPENKIRLITIDWVPSYRSNKLFVREKGIYIDNTGKVVKL